LIYSDYYQTKTRLLNTLIYRLFIRIGKSYLQFETRMDISTNDLGGHVPLTYISKSRAIGRKFS